MSKNKLETLQNNIQFVIVHMRGYKGTWWLCQNTKFWVSPQPEDIADCCIPDSFGFRLWDLLQCFTTHHTVDSHFQGHKKTELLIIHALSHSKQTGKRFHCLSYYDAMSYSLQAYFKFWCVSLFYLRLFKFVWTTRNNSLVFPLIPSLWFCCVFHSFILSLLRGVYPILPPSSLFVLIMSVEAHAACPQRESDGEAHRRTKKSKLMRQERTLSFHGRLLMFHFCRIGLFVCPESRFSIPHFWYLVHFLTMHVSSPDVLMHACG